MGWWSAKRPLILGHRGASAEAPENTLASFSLAKAQGADGIELDVQLSADGYPVVIHDFKLDRTTTGKGFVSDFPLSHLKTLGAGAEQTVPALAEVFEHCGPDFLYNVELKSTLVFDRNLVTAVVKCVQAYDLAGQVLVSSFNPLIVRLAKQQMPVGTMVAHLWQKPGGRWKHKLAKADADHPNWRQVGAAYMNWAQKEELRVHVWTVDDVVEAHRLAGLGVQAIITNRPQTIREGLS